MAVVGKHRDAEIVLLERHDSPFIFCRLKMPDGGWLQKSTKCRNIDAALTKAEQLHDEMRFLHKHGLAVKHNTFSAVCDIYLKELAEDVKLGVRRPRVETDYKTIADRFLRPYFGRKYISQITNADITEYRKWRATYWIEGPGAKKECITYIRNGKKIKRPKPKGRRPSQTTENTENVVLRGIFRTALKHSFLTELQMPTISTDKRRGAKKNRRPAFTKPEYEKLLDFLYHWPNEPDCPNSERRRLLRNYVLFLCHTGLRPGTETDGLCWKHVREKKIKGGEERYVLHVNGKTGPRNPVASGPAHGAIMQIKFGLMEAGTSIEPDMPVFCLPDGVPVKNDYFRALFKKALAKSGLLFDADGNQRSLYSLRHTYATFQLLYNKVGIYLLTEQMGTSVRMIEQHYGHLQPEMAIDDLAAKSVDNFN